MTKKKRIIIITSFCLLLALTAVLNIVLNNNISAKTTTNSNNVITTGNFFTNYRTDRTSTYDQQMEYLKAITESDSVSNEAKQNAEAEMIKLTQTINIQTTLENNIKSLGFSDVVVSALTNNVNVIIKGKSFSDEELSQIVNVIETCSDYTFDNIKIIPVE